MAVPGSNDMPMKFKQFYIAMTNKCNLRCAMCTTATHPYEPEKELSLNQWKAILDNIIRFPVDSIGFGGGEPLALKEELIELVSIVASRGIVVNIVTNATLLKADFLEAVLPYREKILFLLSLDGLEEENDRIRGKGVFKKVIEASDLLQKYQWPFYITSVLQPDNFLGFVSFLTFVSERYPQALIDIQPIIPHNEIYYRRKNFELDTHQFESLKDILAFLHNNEGVIRLCRPLKIIDKYWDYFTNTLRSENQCKMGTESFNINLRGNLWVCGKELEYPLYQYPLEEIFRCSEYLKEIERVKRCGSPCLAGLVI